MKSMYAGRKARYFYAYQILPVNETGPGYVSKLFLGHDVDMHGSFKISDRKSVV